MTASPYPRSETDPHYAEPDGPIAISRIVHTLRDYAPAIALTVLAVALFYTIVAIAYYVTGAKERITTLGFRLDFQGAAAGTYPNGTKFSPTEIVAAPVLLEVFRNNKLDRFLTFPDFSRSVFVLESNTTLERLAAEYQSLLSDPKLTSVERDRIQKEFDLKRASVAKNEFSLNYASEGSQGMPEPVTRRVLNDVLETWARFAVRDRHVLMYDVSVLSTRAIEPTPIENSDAVIAVHVVRSRIIRVLNSIEALLNLPSAKLVRTKSDGMTLDEIRVRLDEIVRFRVEPLVPVAVSSGSLANPQSTAAFVETQLAHDQRDLEAKQASVTAIRDSVSMYFTSQSGATAQAAMESVGTQQPPSQGGAERTSAVTPQLTESFIDRLLTLTSNAADVEYRQSMVEKYRRESEEVIPLQEAVAYDRNLLEALRLARPAQPGADRAVQTQIASIRAEVRDLMLKVNEIHQIMSENLNPSTNLFTRTSPPYTRVHRARSITRLMLLGVCVVAAALLAACLGALLHRRIRDEELGLTASGISS